MNDAISARHYRERLLNDPYRPTYHFAIPDDNGWPGDSNGAFFADGVYHLMYLYKNSDTNGFHWGHMTSRDLLHWRQHPDALTVHEGDEGCFSGGAFLDDDGMAYLTFWKFPSVQEGGDKGGIAMACAAPPYEKWDRMEPIAFESSDDWGITDVTIDGEVIHLGCADPSNIWKRKDTYYMQLGNKPVLDRYGSGEDSPARYQGGWTELIRSKDLKHWEYVHRFYEAKTGDDWPDCTEDDMCPSFLPLYDSPMDGKATGQWLQVFISHNKGCQYFVGDLQEETFLPRFHGRMSWKDRAYFAPEALVDDHHRQILWTWLLDNLPDDFNTYGWSGVYGLPRNLWWKDDTLHMAPIQELARLQRNHQSPAPAVGTVPVKNGESFRLKAVWDRTDEAPGIRLKMDPETGEYVDIYYDAAHGKLVMDTTRSGLGDWKIKEEAPFTLTEGEALSLDILVDKSVVEVFANERQAITRRAYAINPHKATGVAVLHTAPTALDVWEMAPANMY